MSKVYLSPSNQSNNTYTKQGTNEMEQCNRIAKAAEKHLIRNGYEVKRAPEGQGMNQSISDSNAWGADIHIPIHTNAGGGKGPLVMVYSLSKENTKYANPVYDELLAIAPQGGGYGVRYAPDMTYGNYMPSEISDTSAYCVYVEAEFHDNSDLARWIVCNVDKIGEAIAKGICKAEGKTYKGNNEPAPEPVEPTPTPTPEKSNQTDFPATPFLVEVVIDDLNYRAEPSMNGAVNGMTGKGLFTIVEVSGEWGKLKSGAGWIYLANSEYCTIKESTKAKDESFLVEIKIPNLNIRSGPGTNYNTVGMYTGVGVFTITEVSSGKGSAAGWGKLKSGAGWIALDYATKL